MKKYRNADIEALIKAAKGVLKGFRNYSATTEYQRLRTALLMMGEELPHPETLP